MWRKLSSNPANIPFLIFFLGFAPLITILYFATDAKNQITIVHAIVSNYLFYMMMIISIKIQFNKFTYGLATGSRIQNDIDALRELELPKMRFFLGQALSIILLVFLFIDLINQSSSAMVAVWGMTHIASFSLGWPVGRYTVRMEFLAMLEGKTPETLWDEDMLREIGRYQ